MKLRFLSFVFLLCMFLLAMKLTGCRQIIPSERPSTVTISATPTPTRSIASTATMISATTLRPTLWTPTVNPKSFETLFVFDNLDQSGEWKGYTEGSPEWTINKMSAPSLDGESLLCSITGGTPYSNLHCYQNLPSEPTADTFELTLSFLFSPTTSCNNQEITSIVQALEFTMNKWYRSKRYEFALQWQNVGVGASQWRYWSPHESEKWAAFNPSIPECLEGQRWHTITIIGSIRDDQIYYESFTIDNQSHEINLPILPVSTPGEADRLAVAVQLDGNANQTPYDMYIDKVVFTVKSSQP